MDHETHRLLDILTEIEATTAAAEEGELTLGRLSLRLMLSVAALRRIDHHDAADEVEGVWTRVERLHRGLLSAPSGSAGIDPTLLSTELRELRGTAAAVRSRQSGQPLASH